MSNQESVYNYLNNYLIQCLGLQEVMKSSIFEMPSLQPHPPENDVALNWEFQEAQSAIINVLFIRVLSESQISDVENSKSIPLLYEMPKALETFCKLRQALKLEPKSSPYLEVLNLEELKRVLSELRLKTNKIILMMGNNILKGDPLKGDGGFGLEWIIPDPVYLESHPELKRPTWELLKLWMEQEGDF